MKSTTRSFIRPVIPYGRQSIDGRDIRAVAQALQSDWLTQGPTAQRFEEALARYCQVQYTVVFSSGTAALHAAYYAVGLGSGDEFVTSPLTFAATANAGLYHGARPIFADIDLRTGNIDPRDVEQKITKKTKAIVAVDYAGNPAALDRLRTLAHNHKLILIEDACHALGATYKSRPVGSISDLSVFSFHPVKSITTGEGGAVTTNDHNFYERLLLFRNHGITKDYDKLQDRAQGAWYHEMQDLGFNYRLTDIQAALGLSQLKRLPQFIKARRAIASRYQEQLASIRGLTLPDKRSLPVSSWHLYPVRVSGRYNGRRAEIFQKLRDAGIGVQVHYIPVYWHPYYQQLGYPKGLCPKAEAYYQSVISLPIFPRLTRKDQDYVIMTLKKIINEEK